MSAAHPGRWSPRGRPSSRRPAPSPVAGAAVPASVRLIGPDRIGGGPFTLIGTAHLASRTTVVTKPSGPVGSL